MQNIKEKGEIKMEINKLKQMTREKKLSFIRDFFSKDTEALGSVMPDKAANSLEPSKLIHEVTERYLAKLADEELLCLCIEIKKHQDDRRYKIDWVRYCTEGACGKKEASGAPPPTSIDRLLSGEVFEDIRLCRRIIQSMTEISASQLYHKDLLSAAKKQRFRDRALEKLCYLTGLSAEDMKSISFGELLKTVHSKKCRDASGICSSYADMLFYISCIPAGFTISTLQYLKEKGKEGC